MRFPIRTSKFDSETVFYFNTQPIIQELVCKYLAVLLDSQLSFKCHVEKVCNRLSTQCGIISKLRHYVPRSVLLKYYVSNVQPIIQYGLLVYGCCPFSNLYKVLIWQKRIMKTFYFRRRDSSTDDVFESYKVLSVYELHIYELLNFFTLNEQPTFWRSFEQQVWDSPLRSTRSSSFNLLKQKLCREKIEENSVYYRCTKLFNVLISANLLPPNVWSLSTNQVANFVHKFSNCYLVNNLELVKLIFH